MCEEQQERYGEKSFPNPDVCFNVGTGLFSSTLLLLLLPLHLWYGVCHVHNTSVLLVSQAGLGALDRQPAVLPPAESAPSLREGGVDRLHGSRGV